MAGGDADSDADDNVVCTITKNGDGSYTVFAGDEPESGGAGDTDDGSEDDADALGPAGAAPAPGGAAAGGMGAGGGGGNGATPQGIPADSVGAALKAALDILNADKSSEGAPGNADDQFAGGFNSPKSPTPIGLGAGP
jgi:hypothetical protein